MNVVRFVHGEEVAENTRNEHSRLFQSRSGLSVISIRENARKSSQPFTAEDSKAHQGAALPESSTTNVTLPRSLVFDQTMGQVLFNAGLVSSRSQGERLCASNGAYVGAVSDLKESHELEWRRSGEMKQKDVGPSVIDGDLLLLRVGKTKIRIITVIADEDFEARGLVAPGKKTNIGQKGQNAT